MKRVQHKTIRDKTDDHRGTIKPPGHYGTYVETIAQEQARKRRLPVLTDAIRDSEMLMDDLAAALKRRGIEDCD